MLNDQEPECPPPPPPPAFNPDPDMDEHFERGGGKLEETEYPEDGNSEQQ
jgi:hypothetical protein